MINCFFLTQRWWTHYMTFKEYINWEPKDLEIDAYFSSELNEEEIQEYYDLIRKELMNGKYTLQNDKQVQC